MSIPAFPEWREIELADKPVFDRALAANPPDLSTYTFTNLFAWRGPYHSEVCELDGMLLVRDVMDGRQVYLDPIGVGDAKNVIATVFEQAGDARFERIHKRTADLFADEPGFSVDLDQDNSDYVYLTQDLIELAGRKYDAKRNFINRIRGAIDYEYTEMTQASVKDAHRFAEYWCEERLCQTIDGLNREQCAVYEMLHNLEVLGITGGDIKIEGRVVTFALGEALNPDTFVVHVEKADASIDGIYQLINNEFISHAAAGFKYVNREQDLGVPGLRKAKESYHPCRMIESFTIRREVR